MFLIINLSFSYLLTIILNTKLTILLEVFESKKVKPNLASTINSKLLTTEQSNSLISKK
jgi:hypothetical protein